MSNGFLVNFGLGQVSVICPLLLMLVLALIRRKISTTYVLRTIVYADDHVIVAEHREELSG